MFFAQLCILVLHYRPLVVCAAHYNTASTYQFVRKRSVCIYDGDENYTVWLYQSPDIPLYLYTAQAYMLGDISELVLELLWSSKMHLNT